MSDLIERLQKMSVCVYLATEEAVAADISDGLKKAIERIAELEASLSHAEANLAFECKGTRAIRAMKEQKK